MTVEKKIFKYEHEFIFLHLAKFMSQTAKDKT